MNKIFRVVPVLVLVLGILVVSLGIVGAQDVPGPGKYFLVSHGGPGNPFWIVAIKGMEDACAFLGAECQWLGDNTFGFDNMPGYMDDALAAGADGIGITAARPEAVEEGAMRAMDMGLPVIAFNAPDTRDDPIPYLFYIGGDEFLGGVAVAEHMLAERDVVHAICPIQEPGHVGLETRCAGFRSVMEAEGIFVQNLATDNDTSIASGILTDYYLANPELDAVFSLGPLPSDAYYQFLDENGVDPSTILHGTFDLSPAILNAILDGRTLVAIDQQQYLQGFETIMWLYLNHNFGLAPANDILTGPGPVTAANASLVQALAGTYR
jgi:simple sugar transport system substrate-binding protein